MAEPAAPDPGRPKRRPATSWQESLRDAGPYLHLGMQLGLSLVFFVGVGYLFDRWLGTTPWLLIAGGLVGMVAAFLYLVRVSKQMGGAGTASKPAKTPGEDPAEDDGSEEV